MKLIQKSSRRGIAMTEYLIILAVVAIAAITIVGLFGKQIKAVFSNATEAMGGSSSQTEKVETTDAVKQDDMKTGTAGRAAGGTP